MSYVEKTHMVFDMRVHIVCNLSIALHVAAQEGRQMARMKSSQWLMREARDSLRDVAAGAFTPIVLEAYEHFDGERGWLLGYPSETQDGHSCVIWSHKPAAESLEAAQ